MIVLNIENGEDVTIVILGPVDVESVINKNASLAQLVEHLTVNQKVTSSSLVRSACSLTISDCDNEIIK